MNIQIISTEDLDQLFEYDKTIHITERRKMIIQYIEQKDYGILAKDKQGNICGCAFTEKKPLATKVTPLYADNISIAKKLLKYIVNKLPRDEKYRFIFQMIIRKQ